MTFVVLSMSISSKNFQLNVAQPTDSRESEERQGMWNETLHDSCISFMKLLCLKKVYPSDASLHRQ